MLSQKQLYQVLKFPKHLQVSVIALLKMEHLHQLTKLLQSLEKPVQLKAPT